MPKPWLLLLASLPSAGLAETYVVRTAPTPRPAGYGTIHIDKAGISGREIRVWAASILNADCTPAGTIDVDVIDKPRHGALRLSNEPFHPNYPQSNPRVVCDARTAPGEQAFYASEPGFRGHDRIALRSATSEGRIRRVVIDIDVR